MNLRNLILLNILTPVYALLQTRNFGWIQHNSNHINTRINNFYKIENDNDNVFLKSIERISKIEGNKSNTVLLEAFHTKGNSICGFIGINDHDKFTIFTGIVLKGKDIRPLALFELKDHHIVDTAYLTGNKWMLEYSMLL